MKNFNIITKKQLEDFMVETQLLAINSTGKEYKMHKDNLITLERIYNRNFYEPLKKYETRKMKDNGVVTY
jgi:hypothetical protein